MTDYASYGAEGRLTAMSNKRLMVFRARPTVGFSGGFCLSQ